MRTKERGQQGEEEAVLAGKSPKITYYSRARFFFCFCSFFLSYFTSSNMSLVSAGALCCCFLLPPLSSCTNGLKKQRKMNFTKFNIPPKIQ